MSCLTPDASLAGECGFLSANMYARSLFGEDALANLSIEQLEDGTIQGHVRIRSKTQGIALSLGDKSESLLAFFLPLSLFFGARAKGVVTDRTFVLDRSHVCPRSLLQSHWVSLRNPHLIRA